MKKTEEEIEVAARKYALSQDGFINEKKSGFKAGAKWMQEQDNWISVEDRLPEFGEEFNCVQNLDDGGDPVSSITEYDAIKKIFCYPGTDTEQSGITHWQPIHEPPKH